MPRACLTLLESWAPFWYKWAVIESLFIFHQKWFQIIPNKLGSLFEVLPNQFSCKTLCKRVFASKPKIALHIVESTSKTDRSTPNEPNACIRANKPKQSTLLSETTCVTSRKHVFTSKTKTALRVIESTSKTDRSTPNEAKAHETANKPKQRASRNETTHQTVSTNPLDCEHFKCEGVQTPY